MKKIHVIYTGGTIGMLPGPNGYAPATGYLENRLSSLFQQDNMAITFTEYPNLIDSADLHPAHWNTFAQDIAQHYPYTDGFVLLHGTDTMAYTAAVLSFMLENLGKPVILTGAQIPLCEKQTDGEKNLLAGLFYASQHQLAGIYVAFGGRLLQGNRVRKVDSDSLTAFATPNFPPLVDEAQGIRWHPHRLAAVPNKPFRCQTIQTDLRIASCKLVPGYTYHLLTEFLQDPLQGLVIESYGTGNGPTNQPALLQAMQRANAQGCHIINVSQCLHGHVAGTYAAGQTFAAAGAISGADITPEAALAKLYYCLSKTTQHSAQKSLLQHNLCGEMH